MDTLLNRVDVEAIALLGVLFGADGIALVAMIVGIWLLTVTLKKAMRLRAGLLSHPLAIPFVNFIGFGAAVAALVRYLFRAAPLLVTFVVVVAGAAMVFGLGLRARAWIAGLGQVLMARLSVGDRLTFSVASGTVERIGLFRLTMRANGGEQVHVPIAALDGQAFHVSSPQRAFPVHVVLQLEAPAAKAQLDAIRTLARLCPYRAVASETTVTVDETNPQRLHVRFQAWSEAAARHAETYLRARMS